MYEGEGRVDLWVKLGIGEIDWENVSVIIYFWEGDGRFILVNKLLASEKTTIKQTTKN